MRWTRALLLAAIAVFAPLADARDMPATVAEVRIDDLPAEARQTLALIRRGGPFPYRKDGAVFGNRERRLPPQPRGYYTEYTVKTPYSRDRGGRRIVAGRGADRNAATSDEYYYTDDHYKTFRRIRE
ncbi:MAG TPA: ribonuclease domain-containing protein [Burkholderiaceae bacterium]|nr:ribonuclease domain-containing protein [Burkholderiaceae bacterium]